MDAEAGPALPRAEAEFDEAVAEAVSREIFSNYRVTASVPWLAERARAHPGQAAVSLLVELPLPLPL